MFHIQKLEILLHKTFSGSLRVSTHVAYYLTHTLNRSLSLNLFDQHAVSFPFILCFFGCNRVKSTIIDAKSLNFLFRLEGFA